MYNMQWRWDRETREPRLHILTADGVHKMKFPFQPYLYVRDPDTKKLEKIECQTPTRVRDIRNKCELEGIETFEADIPYTRRVMMDLGWKVSDPTKYLIYDIEVDDSGDFPDPKLAKYRIVSICAKDNEGKTFTFCDDDEKKMVKQFLKLVYEYHIIAGWNSSRFDLPYILNRCSMWLSIPTDDFQIVDLDLMPLYRFVTLVEKESFALDAIAKVEKVGAKTMHVGDNRGIVRKLFETNRKELIAYNTNDVEMAWGIEKKYSLINILFALCQNCHTLPREHFYFDENGIPRVSAFQGVETKCIVMANKKGIRVPSKHDNPPPTYEGGMVMDPPVKGVVENIAVLDYVSLYPNIMRMFNIGPDTYIDDKSGAIQAPLGSFRNDVTSYIVDTIDEMMHMKEEMGALKKKVDKGSFEGKALFWKYHSVKVVINSIFGATGFFRSRVYKFQCCQNVQSIERLILTETIRYARELGYEIFGADTDSIFVKVKTVEEAIELAHKITMHMREWVKQFGVTNVDCLELEPDKFFISLMIIAKKKYAGIHTWADGKDDFDIYKRGLESVRHDWPLAVRTFQDKLLRKILTKKNWREYIEETKQKFYCGELDSEMVIYKTLKKKPEEYNIPGPHVRAAVLLGNRGTPVKVGDKVGYLKVGDEKHQVVAILPGSDQKIEILASQRDYVWGKMFKSIIERFHVERNATLSDYFGEEGGHGLSQLTPLKSHRNNLRHPNKR